MALASADSVYAPFLIWRCVPCGGDTLVFRCDEVLLRRCCGCGERQLPVEPESLEVRKQPFCSLARLVRDALLAFIVAFLFHLVPSIIWGAESSLGSSKNHQLMGVVWFGGWPAWFLVLQLLRPWCLVVRDGKSVVRVPFASWQHASEVARWWEQGRSGPPPARPRVCDAWMIVGLLLLLGLLINALYTGVEVMACMDRGCCKDNEATLASCEATGYTQSEIRCRRFWN